MAPHSSSKAQPAPFASFAAEFPNDNSGLHLGTIWMSESLCGPAEAHLPREPAWEIVADGAPTRDEVEEDDLGDEEAIEIVDSIVLEGPIEIVPAPRESGVVASAFSSNEGSSDESSVDERSAGESSTEHAALGAGEPDDLSAERTPPMISTPPPPLNDPFEELLQTLSDVACDAGHLFAASEIAAFLAGDPVAAAWRAILTGESCDFTLCATPLDEWSSVALARIISAPHKAPHLRRELRARGVAAFGLASAA